MRRVAYVCIDPGVPVFGNKGCSVHVREWLRAAWRSGVEVELFAAHLGGDAPADLADLPVHPLPLTKGGDAAAREEALLKLDAHLPEVLERFGPFDLIYERHSLFGLHAMRFARAKGIFGLLEVNAPLVEEQLRHRTLIDEAGARNARRGAFAAAHRVVAVSALLGECIRVDVGSTPVVIIPNGVDCEHFRPDIPSSFCESDGAFVVGFAGTLKAWHGIDTLVTAFSRIVDSIPSARLLMVGDGPKREACERELSRIGLRDRAHFSGSLPHAEVPGLLASMDVAVAPYPKLDHFYFSPLKVYEYLAMGLPVVASRIGQVEAAIRSGDNGLLVEAGDPVALADAIVSVANNVTLRADLGRRARESVVANTWASVVARTFALAEDPGPRWNSA